VNILFLFDFSVIVTTKDQNYGPRLHRSLRTSEQAQKRPKLFYGYRCQVIDNVHIEVLHVMEIPAFIDYGTMGGGEIKTADARDIGKPNFLHRN